MKSLRNFKAQFMSLFIVVALVLTTVPMNVFATETDTTGPVITVLSCNKEGETLLEGDSITLIFSLEDESGIGSNKGMLMTYRDPNGENYSEFLGPPCVYNSETGLYECTYTVSSTDKVGTYKFAKLHAYDAKGNYSSIRPDKNFYIGLADINDFVINEIAAQEYTGEKITPSIDVYYEGDLLEEGVYYNKYYDNNINLGNARVIITKTKYSVGEERTVGFNIIHPNNHDYDSKWTIVKEATCTEDGSKYRKCTICEATTDVTTIEKLGHDFGEWIEIQSSSCVDMGSEQRICKRCQLIETRNVQASGHTWETDYTVDKESTCTEEGSKSIHCSECDATKAVRTIIALGHKYESETSKATTSKNGSVVTKCSVCGDVKSSETIYYPKTMKLSTTNYTYSGGVKKPTVSVVDANGKTISSSNYTVSYASGRKSVGKYKVTVTFKGDKYSGSKYTYFNINPKGTSISKVSGAKKAFTVKWKKQSSKMATSRIIGYQIKYSTSSKMTSAKTKTIKSYKSTSKKITKLKAKKKYYVQVRTYKTVSGKNYYSSWSSVKSVKTK